MCPLLAHFINTALKGLVHPKNDNDINLSLGSVRFFLKEINTSIQEGCIKLVKSNIKDIYGTFYLKCFELSIHQELHHIFLKNTKQHNCIKH